MDPSFQSKVRWAKVLWALWMVTPLVYVSVAVQIDGALADSSLSFLLPLILLASIGVIATIFWFQFSKRARTIAEKRRSPFEATLFLFRSSSMLSEALSIYGFVLTLLLGMLAYVLGFSLVTWVLLAWVRIRFKSS